MAGHIITVVGGKGGQGKSQVAANMAFAYAAETRGKVLLLDFDQKAGGDQTLITGLKLKKNLKDLSEFNGAFDARSIQQFITAHSQGVSFIGMPSDKTEITIKITKWSTLPLPFVTGSSRQQT